MVTVRVLAPRTIRPEEEPVRLTIDTPPEAPEMSRVPLSNRVGESAIPPAPASFSVAPELIVVAPV